MPGVSIHFVVGILLLTTFVSVGLMGLWAGLAKWHWFFRSLVVVAAFLPLILIPAYEVLLALLIQVLICTSESKIYLGVTDVQEHSRGMSDASRQSLLRYLRCSVADLLLAMVLAAILLFVYGQMSTKELLHDWSGYLLTGSMVGVTSLVSAWVVFSRASFVLRSIVVVIVIASASAFLACFNEWTEYFTAGSFQSSSWTLLWIPVVVGTSLLLFAALWLLRESRAFSVLGRGRVVKGTDDRPLRRIFGACFFLLILPTVAVPAITCWKLLNPRQMLRMPPPEPNGYEALVSAGKMFNSPILGMVVAPTSTRQLAAEVEKYAEAYERVWTGLSYEFANPRWYSKQPLGEIESTCIDDFSSFRNIARALSMNCELARRENRFNDAATCAMGNIQLGKIVAQQGVVTDYLTGTTIQGIGRSDLFSVAGKLKSTRYRVLVEELANLQPGRDSLDAVVDRDRTWTENVYGWQGHLFVFLWDIAGGYWVHGELYETIHLRDAAESRLLLMEVALHAYYAEHEEFPSRLADLVPTFIPRMFEDPFSGKGEPFVYHRSDDVYTLYSLGQNRQDDGGINHDETANGLTDWNTGDLRLDFLYDE